MKKIDWVRKLTSRKLWTAVAIRIYDDPGYWRYGQHSNTGYSAHYGRSVRGGIHHRRRFN